MKLIYTFIISTLLFVPHNLHAQSDTERIQKHLTAITKTEGFRNFEDTVTLNKVADYIFTEFSQYADTTYYQTYTVDNVSYKNVICRFGTK